MRVELKELLKKLGIDRVLSPYETQPWLFYDETQGITASAEVRMGPGNEDLEAEVQFIHDEKDEDESEDGESTETLPPSGREQIMHMRAIPTTATEWSPTKLDVKGKDYVNEIHDWEGKGCTFFKACVQAMNMGEMPNIDELIEKELNDSGGGGGGKRGKIGRKSPKIKPNQLLGMKGGL